MRNKGFWIELMSMLGLLLVVVSMVLTGLMKARQMNQQARDLTQACLIAESKMEAIRGKDKALIESLQSTNYFYYDRHWEPVEENQARFILQLNVAWEGQAYWRQAQLNFNCRDSEGREIIVLQGKVLLD